VLSSLIPNRFLPYANISSIDTIACSMSLTLFLCARSENSLLQVALPISAPFRISQCNYATVQPSPLLFSGKDAAFPGRLSATNRIMQHVPKVVIPINCTPTKPVQILTLRAVNYSRRSNDRGQETGMHIRQASVPASVLAQEFERSSPASTR